MHVFLAAFIWTAIGGTLFSGGMIWSFIGYQGFERMWVVIAVGLGFAKAHWVLGQASTRMVDRIRERGDGRCIGGFLSIRTWLLVIIMMTGGRIIRSGIVPREVAGVIYVGVGTALLIASIQLWRPWANWE